MHNFPGTPIRTVVKETNFLLKNIESKQNFQPYASIHRLPQKPTHTQKHNQEKLKKRGKRRRKKTISRKKNLKRERYK